MPIVGVPLVSSGAYSSIMGRDALLARYPWLTRPVVAEALNGLVNGSNKRFRLGARPALSGTVVITDMAGATVTPASVDEASGSVILSAAPSATLFADYTHCALTDSQLAGFFVAGFEHMESIWPRGYKLAQSGGVYYVSSSAAAVVDPVVSDSTFSVRPPQYSLLVGCMAYQWAMSMWGEAAAHGIMTREKLAVGIQIDRTKQPTSLKEFVAQWTDVIAALVETAMTDSGDSSMSIGSVAAYQDLMPNVFVSTISISEPV